MVNQLTRKKTTTSTVDKSTGERLWRRKCSDLFDGDGRPPVFVLLQDRQTHSARWVDIWVEYWWFKLAWVEVIEKKVRILKLKARLAW